MNIITSDAPFHIVIVIDCQVAQMNVSATSLSMCFKPVSCKHANEWQPSWVCGGVVVCCGDDEGLIVMVSQLAVPDTARLLSVAHRCRRTQEGLRVHTLSSGPLQHPHAIADGCARGGWWVRTPLTPP